MERILIVAHDAGGAEVVSAWLRQQTCGDYALVLSGPAVAIFARKAPEIPRFSAERLQELVATCDRVVTGTSWASDLEKEAIRVARSLSRPVNTFLDHWANYPQRFELNGKLVMPDELWVGDEYAWRLARESFPNQPLRLVPNPYFQEITEQLTNVALPGTPDRGVRILYVSEPTSERSMRDYGHPFHWGYTEFQALQAFLSNVTAYAQPKTVETIRIRLHPAERSDKYASVLQKFRELPITISQGTTLIEDCAWAHWVVGCESMAMIVGLLAEREVYCVIPNPEIPCSLPHEGIKRFGS